jgi:hypothetical protein
MSQDNETTAIIMNKKDEYKELLKKVIPFTNSDNKIVKRAAYNFNTIIKCAINESNNSTLTYLSEGIEHAIEYFKSELLNLINDKFDSNTHVCNPHYGLLNDISSAILTQLLFRNKLEEFKTFLMAL